MLVRLYARHVARGIAREVVKCIARETVKEMSHHSFLNLFTVSHANLSLTLVWIVCCAFLAFPLMW